MILLFDCDGTVVDSEILNAEFEIEFYREEFGLELNALEHARRFVGLMQEEAFSWLEKKIERKLPESFRTLYADRKRAVFEAKLKSIPFVAETLAKLVHYPKAIVSNTPTQPLYAALRTTGLLNLFAPNLFSAEMVARGKPAPDVYIYAAKMMGVDNKDCLVIEDTPTGVAAARAAGMRVFGFAGGGHCYPEYAAQLNHAELVFTDMRELPALIEEKVEA